METTDQNVEENNDPTYQPPTPSRKSDRLKNKSRVDFNLYRRPRDSNKIWEEREKKTFYNAIKQYGTKNWREVAKCLPTKSENVVKNWILREKRKQILEYEKRAVKVDGSYVALKDTTSRKRSDSEGVQDDLLTPDQRQTVQIEEVLVPRESKAPVDQWMRIIEEYSESELQKRKEKGLGPPVSCEKMIPMSLHWIAELEDHPSPEECGGIDYAAIYRYLYCLSEGDVPPDLDSVSAARVTRLLSDFSNLVRSTSLEKEKSYLENYNGPFTRYRTSEKFNDKSKSAKLLGDISSTPGMNPLNIHLELCLDKEIDHKPLVMLAKNEDQTEDI